MGNLAIIPARGGSKRIPRKNIRDFLGKPIIAYSIEAALKSKLFDEVMVSTDDYEIADLSKKFGATVPFIRSAETSDDHSTTYDVISEVINTYSAYNKAFDKICCIYATSPLITPKVLYDSYEVLIKGGFTTVFPTVEFSYPIWRSLQVFTNGKVEMIWPENQLKRSQDLQSTYHDAGQFYWADVDKLLIEQKLFTPNSGTIVLNEMDVQDIDSESDWELAEYKYKFRIGLC